jgi:acyl-coenzyme A thioesterase PaaI-like protein
MTATQDSLDALRAAQHDECLLCGAANPLGLKLRFRVQPDGSVLALFACPEALRSYPETLHGGVVSALLDAAMTNALFAVGITGVTAELTVRFVAPVSLNRGALVRGSVEKDAHPLYYVRAGLEQDGTLKARASAKFLVKPGEDEGGDTRRRHGERPPGAHLREPARDACAEQRADGADGREGDRGRPPFAAHQD